MRKSLLAASVFALLNITLLCRAQKRVEAALYADYLDLSQTDTSNVGIGGRFGYRVHQHVMMEGELSYGYGVNFKEAYRDIANGDTRAIARTSIGVTDGLFGPMIEPAHGHLRPFATIKGGFIDFRLSPSLIPYSDVVSSIFGIRTSRVNAALYPGAGAEAVFGPVGLRLDAGDEIYFNHGAHNNLRIAFGPLVRF
jgi:hypothetical protein